MKLRDLNNSIALERALELALAKECGAEAACELLALRIENNYTKPEWL